MFKERIRKIYSCRKALWDLARKQLKAKYAGSRLGLWWAVVAPLLLAASINFVFSAVFKVQMPNYTLFVLSGLIPWVFSSCALTECATSFLDNASLLKQATFPRELIPLSSVLANLLNFLIGLIFLLPVFIIFNPRVVLGILPLAAAIGLHFFFLAGLGLIFSVTTVFLRDLVHFLSVAFTAWFWVTPIFYSLDMLPDHLRVFAFLNPMTYFVVSYQDILFKADLPALRVLSVAAALSLAALALGYGVFLKEEAALLKRL
ncbi:MAG: ABC transporter permease [Candidatus Omnitrophica bacterium]|nr:ABC transporter permease [Candidatus Omnitrophota bacterium]